MRRREILRSAAGVIGVGTVGASSRALDRWGPVDRVAGATPGTDGQDEFGPLGSLEVTIARETVVDEAGTTAFVAAGDGFATVDLSDPADPTLLTRVDPAMADHERGPMANVWDVSYDDGRLLVGAPATRGGEFYGLALYDVRDPADPTLESTLRVPHFVHNCYLDGETAYFTSRGVGIVDASGGELAHHGRWRPTEHDPRWAETDPGVVVNHDIWADGDRAYLSYWDAGCFIIDVSQPSAPEFVGRAGHLEASHVQYADSDQASWLPGNAHYAETNPSGDLLAVGKEAGEPSRGPGGIDLWDLSDETEPEYLVTIEPPGETLSPDREPLWTTAHNFDFVEDRLYTSWYAGGVRVFDVSDPTEPLEIAAWQEPTEGYFWSASLAVPGEYFVAGSKNAGRVDGRQSGVFVFPDPTGDGEPADTSELTPTQFPTPTATFTPSPEETATETQTDTPTATPTSTASGRTPAPTAGDDDTDTSSDGGPGFGPLAALAGVGVGAWRLLGRSDGTETDEVT